MRLLLTRYKFGAEATLGTLEVIYDGEEAPRRFGWVLEDRDRGLDVGMSLDALRQLKVPSETAIPTGTYQVRFTHSPKYGRPMLQLLDVPGYQGIRIHAGNDNSDTEGCLLPGLARDEHRMIVQRSRPAVRWLEQYVRACEDRGEPVTICIRRDATEWRNTQEKA